MTVPLRTPSKSPPAAARLMDGTGSDPPRIAGTAVTRPRLRPQAETVLTGGYDPILWDVAAIDWAG
jgi:hypothetical protein